MKLISNKEFSQPVSSVLCVMKSEPDKDWTLDRVMQDITHGDMDYAQHALGQLTATGWLTERPGRLNPDRKYYRLSDAGRRARLWFPPRDFPTSSTVI